MPIMKRLGGKKFVLVLVLIIGFFAFLLSFPAILTFTVLHEREKAFEAMREEFPVTVNPREKTITESDLVNAYLEDLHSPFHAAVYEVSGPLRRLFELVAVAISRSPWYEAIASTDGRLVLITAGMRKEQAANSFGSALGWGTIEKQQFLTRGTYSSLPLTEGSFSPGVYLVEKSATPLQAQALVNERFSSEVIARYSSTTAKIVPFEDALTIASLIEREAAGQGDMRLVSGIIWNRLFINMPLQIDATLQYAKANAAKGGNWWPQPIPRDRFIKSLFNTYLHKGLPPAPIANPSVASVLAALNPKKTSCLFYFHDAHGGFHCSETYEGHVALLKKYYGRGK